MVALEEITSEEQLKELEKAVLAEQEDEEEDYVTESEAESDTDSILDETLYERIVALQDAFPFSITKAAKKTWRSVFRAGKFCGSALWVLATGSVILLPLAMEFEKEQAAIAQESQMMIQQQQAQQVSLI